MTDLLEQARRQCVQYRDRVAVITRPGGTPEIVEAFRLPYMEATVLAIYRPEGDGAVLCGGNLYLEQCVEDAA